MIALHASHPRDVVRIGGLTRIALTPDTPHRFNAGYRRNYRKDKAEGARKRMLAWFKKYGVA